MLPAEKEIITIKRILAGHHSSDPQKWLDEELVIDLKVKLEKLQSGLEDFHHNKRKEK